MAPKLRKADVSQAPTDENKTFVLPKDVRDEMFKLVRLMNEGMDSAQKESYESSLMTVMSMLMMVYSGRFLGDANAGAKHYSGMFSRVAHEQITLVMKEVALDTVVLGVDTMLPLAIREVVEDGWQTEAGTLTLRELVRSCVEKQVGTHLMSQYDCNVNVSVTMTAK